MRYVIMGDPVPLARPRFSRGRVYDKQRNLKLVAGINLRNQHNNTPLLAGPLHLDAEFHMKIPVKGKHARLDNRYHIYRPDVDNLLKFICDISQGIIFKDDSEVSSISIAKRYAIEPRTEFEFIEIDTEPTMCEHCGHLDYQPRRPQ